MISVEGRYYVFTAALPGEDDFVDILGYLHTLDKTQLLHLGMVLGLSLHRMRDMMDTPTFLDDMILLWLQQADQVVTKSGIPTWRSLAKALRHQLLGQNGIAGQIVMDKGLYLQLSHYIYSSGHLFIFCIISCRTLGWGLGMRLG